MKEPKIIGVIPARYKSTRFPGKPLADICGKPMIWWVYQQVIKVSELDEVYVATDDSRIQEICEEYGMKYVMTKSIHKSSTERVGELATKVNADYYLVINGDEPLISPDTIRAIIPHKTGEISCFVRNLMTEITDPVEALDPSNIKVIVDTEDNAIFFSRSMIPFPKSSLRYSFYKHVGVLLYCKEALSFFVDTLPGPIEKIEDINELRFIEHGKRIKMIRVKSDSLSVDTPKDLEKVESLIKKRNGEN